MMYSFNSKIAAVIDCYALLAAKDSFTMMSFLLFCEGVYD